MAHGSIGVMEQWLHFFNRPVTGIEENQIAAGKGFMPPMMQKSSSFSLN
jgi:hypothetical protein